MKSDGFDRMKISEKQKINWIEKLKPLAKKYNVAEDLIDWNAIIDSTLSYGENKKKIEEHIKNNFQFEMEKKQAEEEMSEFERVQHEEEEKRTKLQLEKEIKEIKEEKSSILEGY